MPPIPINSICRWVIITSATAYFSSLLIALILPWYFAHVDALPYWKYDDELAEMRGQCGWAVLASGTFSAIATWLMLILVPKDEGRLRRKLWINMVLYSLTFLLPIVISLFLPAQNMVRE